MKKPETSHPDVSGLKPCAISVQNRDDKLEIHVSGDWLIGATTPQLRPILSEMTDAKPNKRVIFNTENLGHWDSALMTDLLKLIDRARKKGVEVDTSSLPDDIQGLLALVYAVPNRGDARRRARRPTWQVALNTAGEQALLHGRDTLIFVGELLTSLMGLIRGQARFRKLDFLIYLQECGPGALPIVTLISLLVGLILAFVGAVQLSLFGAQIYIANLVSLGMTREMGGLMTAIIMSGRTGAAYAAQIGTMQVNDEIDALKTMNLEPMVFLVLPRMLALIVIMPLLCLYADLMGIVGGMAVSVNYFDVSLTEYIDRTTHAAKLNDFLVGFGKSAVFGVLIALSGCMRGMQCGRSASAVGDAATSAVVTSIVLIVVADSIMTLMCNALKI